MEFPQFEQQTQEDTQLSALVQDLAGEIGPLVPQEGNQRYVAVVDDAIIGFVTYVLFRWAKDAFDHERAMNETAVAERRARLIASLMADGFAQEQAKAVTDGLLTQIAKRTEDDSVLQKAIALIGSGNSPH